MTVAPPAPSMGANASARHSPIRQHWPLALLLLVAGLVYAQTLDAHGMFIWDEAEYAALARSLVRDGRYTVCGQPQSLRPPLLPLAGAASLWLSGGESDRALKGATVGFALLALGIVYAATTSVYGRMTGLIAAALLAMTPWFWTSTAEFLSEIPFLALFAGAVFCWSFGLYRSPRSFYLSWLCLGLAFLTRYTALLFGPLAVCLTLAALATRDPAVRRRVLSRDFALAPLGAAIAVAPWLIRQMWAFGDPLIGVRQASQQLQVYLPGVSMPWYGYLVGLPTLLSVPTVLCLGFGAAWALRQRDGFAVQCAITVAFVLVWFSAYRYKELRLVTSMLPAAAVLAALGITHALGRERAALGALAAFVGVTLVISAIAVRQTFAHTVPLGYPAFRQAMAVLRERDARAGLVVGASGPQICWYADRAVAGFPPLADLPALLERAEWVVIVNFERGQPAYVKTLAERLPATVQEGGGQRFHDGRFTTLLIRADRLRTVL